MRVTNLILVLLTLCVFTPPEAVYSAAPTNANCTGSTLLPGFNTVFCIPAQLHLSPSATWYATSLGFKRAYDFWAYKVNTIDPVTGFSPIRVQGQNIQIHIDYVNVGTNAGVLGPTYNWTADSRGLNFYRDQTQKLISGLYLGAVNDNAWALTHFNTATDLGSYPAVNYIPAAILTPFSSGATQEIAIGVDEIDTTLYPTANTDVVMIGAGSSGDAVFQCTASNAAYCNKHGRAQGTRRFASLYTSLSPASLQYSDHLSLLKLRGVTRIAMVDEAEPYSQGGTLGIQKTATDLKIQYIYRSAGASNSLTANPTLADQIAHDFMNFDAQVVYMPTNTPFTCKALVDSFRKIGYNPQHISMGTCGDDFTNNANYFGDYSYVSVSSYFSYNLVGSEYQDNILFPEQVQGDGSIKHSAKVFGEQFSTYYNLGRFPVYSEGASFAAAYSLQLAMMATTTIVDLFDSGKLNDRMIKLYTSSFYGRMAFNQFGMLLQAGFVTEQFDHNLTPQIITPLTSAAIQIVYPKPTNVLLTNDDISKTPSASLGVLSYVFAVLGSWTSLILAESSIYERRINPGGIKFYMFTLASATALALCGFWASEYIAFNGLSTNSYVDAYSQSITLDFFFKPAIAITSVIPIITCVFISYLLMVLNVKPLSNRSQAAAQALMKGKVSANVTGTSTDKKSKDSLTAPATKSNSRETSSNKEGEVDGGDTTTTKKDGVDVYSIWSLTAQLFKFYSLYNLIAVVFLWAAMGICQVMAHSSLDLHADISYKKDYIAGAVIIFVILSFVTLQMFFHLLRFRLIGAFLMGLAIISANELGMHGMKWSYSPSINISSDSITPANITIAAAVVGACIAFILLGIQFAAMKLSRNQLDLIVKKLQKELQNARKQINLKDLAITAHQTTNSYLHSVIQLVSHIRPTFIPAVTAAQLTANDCVVPKTVEKFNQDSIVDILPTTTTERKDNEESHSRRDDNGDATEEMEAKGASDTSNMSSNERLKYFRALFSAMNTQSSAAKIEKLKSTLTLADILNHPICLELFKDGLAKEIASENIAFYLVCKQYSSAQTQDKQLRKLLGSEIMKYYVEPKSQYMVNISSRTRTALLQAYKSGGTSVFNSNFFEPAQKEIYNLMAQDSLQRFMETPQFLFCALVLASARDKGMDKAFTDGNSKLIDMIVASSATGDSKVGTKEASKLGKSKLSKLPSRVVKRVGEDDANRSADFIPAVTVEEIELRDVSPQQVADSSEVPRSPAATEAKAED